MKKYFVCLTTENVVNLHNIPKPAFARPYFQPSNLSCKFRHKNNRNSRDGSARKGQKKLNLISITRLRNKNKSCRKGFWAGQVTFFWKRETF